MARFECCFVANGFKVEAKPMPVGTTKITVTLCNGNGFNSDEVYVVSQAQLRERMVEVARTLSPATAPELARHLQITGK